MGAKGKEGAQIISSSFVGFLKRIHLGESAEEAKCLQIDDCNESLRGPLATQLLCQCEKKKIQLKFGFHCYSFSSRDLIKRIEIKISDTCFMEQKKKKKKFLIMFFGKKKKKKKKKKK